MIKDTKMELAILEAKKAADRNEIPVGAVIENMEGKLVASDGNRTRQLYDPTAHAEIITIRKACSLENQLYLKGYTIYVTLEPCKMCMAAISAARIGRVIFGVSSPKYGAIQTHSEISNTFKYNKKTEIYGGFYQKQITSMMKNFFSDKR
jgi:tRNA(Arg) A34 adenosine deaminase TadA